MRSRDDASEVPRMIGVFVACLVIAHSAVILRLFSRRLKKIQLKTDDWLIITSLVFTTAFICLNFGMMRDGLGRHARFITNAKLYALGVMILEVLYSIAIFIVKLSWIFLLHSIFPGRRLLYVLWATAALITAYTIVQIVCVVLHCLPVEALWEPEIPARCINLDDVFIVCSSFNIFTDVVVLCLPMPDLWKLKISTRQKFQLTFMFLLGGLVCIISIIRVPYLRDISQNDPGWTIVSSAEWSVAECSAATLSACLPTMKPLFNWIFNIASPESNKEGFVARKVYALGSDGRCLRSPIFTSRSERISRVERTGDDSWPLNRAVEAPTVDDRGPYVSIELGSMQVAGAIAH